MEALYSIIVDYKGGTYFSQYKAYNLLGLKEKWVKEELSNLSKIANFNFYQIKTIKRKIFEEKEVEFENMKNAWNNDLGFIAKHYFSMIIVKTDNT